LKKTFREEEKNETKKKFRFFWREMFVYFFGCGESKQTESEIIATTVGLLLICETALAL
jgi:hypothetical protein